MSNRALSRRFDIDILTSTMGLRVDPTLALFTMVALEVVETVFVLTWFQFDLETHSGVLTQMR